MLWLGAHGRNHTVIADLGHRSQNGVHWFIAHDRQDNSNGSLDWPGELLPRTEMGGMNHKNHGKKPPRLIHQSEPRLSMQLQYSQQNFTEFHPEINTMERDAWGQKGTAVKEGYAWWMGLNVAVSMVYPLITSSTGVVSAKQTKARKLSVHCLSHSLMAMDSELSRESHRVAI